MKKLAKIPKPIYELNLALISKILWEAWPKKYFRNIDDFDDCKSFYNDCYRISSVLLNNEIEDFNSNNLVLDGFRQLNLWTLVHISKGNFYDKHLPKSYAAAGRYGWRYVIEKSLEDATKHPQSQKKVATKKDLNRIFTLLFIVTNCSELSNYLHFLPTFLKSITVDFDIKMIAGVFAFKNSNEKKAFYRIRDYVHYSPPDDEFLQFKPWVDNSLIRGDLDNFLMRFYNCDISKIDEFITAVNDAANKLHAIILVQPFDDFVELIVQSTSLSINNVYGILQLMLLNTNHPQYQQRNFLSKSQQYRLLNYSGLVLELTCNFESIYSKEFATKEFITQSKYHVIVSAIIMEDWKNAFVLRLLFGQRSDLRSESTELKRAVIDIEDLYHTKIFERETIKLIEKHKIRCIPNIKKIGKKELPCGEIDGLGYRKEDGTLFIFEMKNLVPSTDAKSMGQIITDHLKPKGYHSKFIRKIAYARDSLDEIKTLFNNRGILIDQIKSIVPYFITNTGNVVKFLVTEYEVLRFDELDEILKNE